MRDHDFDARGTDLLIRVSVQVTRREVSTRSNATCRHSDGAIDILSIEMRTMADSSLNRSTRHVQS